MGVFWRTRPADDGTDSSDYDDKTASNETSQTAISADATCTARPAGPTAAEPTALSRARAGLLSRLLKPPRLLAAGSWWHIGDFAVQVDDPHRLYGQNDVVSGTVHLTVTRPIRMTHIVVKLQGHAHVFRRPHAPGKRRVRRRDEVEAGDDGSPVYLGNGFVSLFEREQVLCGDGRLGEGDYKLPFRLRFPDVSLPTGIDFERGSISYHVTAVATRPTTIAPTLSCDRKIGYVETVDIASLGWPRPRVISLEPARSGRKKRNQPAAVPVTAAQSTSPTEPEETEVAEIASVSISASVTTSTHSAPLSTSALSGRSGQVRTRLQTSYSRSMQPYRDCTDGRLAESQVGEAIRAETAAVAADQDPSEPSGVSVSSPSTSTGPGSAGLLTASGSNANGPVSLAPPVRQNRRRTGKAAKRTTKHRRIVTTIELARSGYLRGDAVGVIIRVGHTKAVTSTNGVIVTLYRQARVDPCPVLTTAGSPRPESGPGSGAERADSEGENAAWSCFGSADSLSPRAHVFRKDLAQSFASMIVNPSTLTADIRTAVRVPDDAFPTIDCVPGRMISFRYFVEVLLDLSAKLGGLENVSHTTMTTTTTGSQQAGESAATVPTGSGSAEPGVFAPTVPVFSMPYMYTGQHFVDTEPVRRNKNIVVCTFEIVVGSIDTDRAHLPQMSPVGEDDVAEPESPFVSPTDENTSGPVQTAPPVVVVPTVSSIPIPPSTGSTSSRVDPGGLVMPVLSEKEQLRLAESLLLPSAPPEIDSSEYAGPSCPPFEPIESDRPDENGLNVDQSTGSTDQPVESAGGADRLRPAPSAPMLEEDDDLALFAIVAVDGLPTYGSVVGHG